MRVWRVSEAAVGREGQGSADQHCTKLVSVLQIAAVVEVVGYINAGSVSNCHEGGGRSRQLTPPPEEDGENCSVELEGGTRQGGVGEDEETEEQLASRPEAVDDDPLPWRSSEGLRT